MDEKKREEIALFRYSLILPFLTPEELEWGVKGEMLKRLVEQVHAMPFSKKQSLHSSTIRRYLAAYRKNGFDGLKPDSRSDIGASRKIPLDVLEKAFQLKKEEPRRSASSIIKIMEAHDMIKPPGIIKPSTLYRIFDKNGLTYKNLKKSKKNFRSFEAEHANQIWQSDVMYGPDLPDPERPGKAKKTYLVALIDDYSRLVPHAEFYWQQKLPHLENTLHKAIIKRGIPEVFYVDNGQIFNAHQINLICAELGIRKINCLPYSPEGKGKIERFFRTVRDGFLVELGKEKVEFLHQLNSKFWAWLEVDYHQKDHSSTDQTPNIRWRESVTAFMRKIEEKQLQEIFLWRDKRHVSKVGEVTVEAIKFEVASFLKDKWVEVRYNPFDLSEIFIYQDGRFLQKARQSKLSRWNTAKKQNDPPPEAEEKAAPSGVKYLAHLEKQHLEKQKDQAKQLLGRSAPPRAEYTHAHFIKDVATVLKRKVEDLHAAELEELEQAWTTYGPLEMPLIHLAMTKAVLEKGYHQHISFYIKHIVDSHLKNKERNKNE